MGVHGAAGDTAGTSDGIVLWGAVRPLWEPRSRTWLFGGRVWSESELWYFHSEAGTRWNGRLELQSVSGPKTGNSKCNDAM